MDEVVNSVKSCSRTRGDEPIGALVQATDGSCSPHARGMNRLSKESDGWDGTVPRTRGDEPTWSLGIASRANCSPHARG